MTIKLDPKTKMLHVENLGISVDVQLNDIDIQELILELHEKFTPMFDHFIKINYQSEMENLEKYHQRIKNIQGKLRSPLSKITELLKNASEALTKIHENMGLWEEGSK